MVIKHNIWIFTAKGLNYAPGFKRFCFMLSCGIYTSCMNCALVSKKQIQQLTFKIFFFKTLYFKEI